MTQPDTYAYTPDKHMGGLFMKPQGKLRKKRNVWYVDLWHNGKRHRVFKYLGVMPCHSIEAARELRTILNDEIKKNPNSWNSNRHKRNSPTHLKKYARQWLKIKQPDIESATFHDYRNSIENHIIPALGNEYLPDITTDMLTIFQQGIKRENKGKHNVMGTLRMIMRSANKSGFLPTIPDFPKLKRKKPKIRYISLADQWTILAQIPPEDRPIFTFTVLTGCRTSEARAFRKVDIKDNHIVFAKTFGRDGELKDVKGFNEAPFPLYPALKELLESTPKNLTPFVFMNPRTGRPYTSCYNLIWKLACAMAGMKYVQLRYNRHSFGCNLINAGIPKSAVQALLRHTNPKMTDFYAEYEMGALELMVNNVFKMEARPGREERK